MAALDCADDQFILSEITLRKVECSKQATFSLNTLAWNNRDGPSGAAFIGFSGTKKVRSNRNSRGHSYSGARGEILGFPEDGLVRKHLPRMFSLIKNES